MEVTAGNDGGETAATDAAGTVGLLDDDGGLDCDDTAVDDTGDGSSVQDMVVSAFLVFRCTAADTIVLWLWQFGCGAVVDREYRVH
jgi:hypothetical protein